MATLSTLDFVNHFADCDRRAAIPLTAADRLRLDALEAIARTVGLEGSDRVEYLRLVARRKS